MTLPKNSTRTAKHGTVPLPLAQTAELVLWIALFLQILKLHIKHKALSKTELKFTLKYPLKLIFLNLIFTLYILKRQNSLNFESQSKCLG